MCVTLTALYITLHFFVVHPDHRLNKYPLTTTLVTSRRTRILAYPPLPPSTFVDTNTAAIPLQPSFPFTHVTLILTLQSLAARSSSAGVGTRCVAVLLRVWGSAIRC